MRKFVYNLFAMLLLTLPATMAAQTSYGIVSGSVTDQTGAVVQHATVTLKSRDTGETHVLQTTDNGAFRVESIGTGVYDVTVEAAGFEKTVVEAVAVAPSVTTSVTPVLKPGKATDTVEVSSSSEILQTQSGEVSATIGTQDINELPIANLNPFSLATTLPGVTTVTTVGLTNGTAFANQGFRPRENNFLIEGQDDNDAGIAGQGLQPENDEAIDSVAFLLNANAAEFGRGGGAVANLVYKSGTNEYHGAVWDRLLDSSLSAVNHSISYTYRAQTPAYRYALKTKSRENIFGFRIGGPIIKNKLFIFASEQYDHYRASATLGTLILPLATPSASGTCGKNYQSLSTYQTNARVANLLTAYAGLRSAATLDPSACTSADTNYREVALGADPVTGVDRGIIQFGSYSRSLGNVQNSSELVIKGDYLATDKDKLQLRFVRSPFTTPFDVGNFPSQLPNLETDQHGISYNAGLVETHAFTPKILNEFRASYGRIGFNFDLTPGTYANPLLGPTVSISSITGYGIPTNTPQGRFHNTYQLQDALTILKGSHSIKFGFDVAQVRVRDAIPFVFYGSISYVNQTGGYSALANYIDDYSGNTGANSSSLTKYFGSNLARPTLTNQGYYLQDHWKATSKLALDLGMRYEYYGSPFNYLPYPAIDPGNLACFPCRVTAQPNYRNFGPRFGFAYTPGETGKTVVRGGFGLFYDNTFTNVADNIQASAPNAATPVIYNSTAGRGTANWSQQFATLNTSPLPTNAVTSTLNRFLNPYTMQYNVAVEQQLPYALSLTAAYVGSRQVHLYGLTFLNPLIPGTSTRAAAPTRGQIAVHDNSGDGSYNGTTLELQRKYRAGASIRLSYTFQKALDDVSEEYTSGNYSAYPEAEPYFGYKRGRDWGPSAFDHKQRAVATVVYNVPYMHPESLAGKIVTHVTNNIQLSSIVSFQTGSVINTQTGIDMNGDGVTNDRPVLTNASAPINTFSFLGTDFLGTAPANTYCDGLYLYISSTCHAIDPTTVHYFLGKRYAQNATISRDNMYAPGALTDNAFTAGREFRIVERAQFLFRAECYNCLNHANTGIPAATLYSSTNVATSPTTFFNYAATQSGNRTVRFFARLQF